MIGWIALGCFLPKLATFCANGIVHQTTDKLADPHKMLGVFLKNQVLKLAIFAIASLIAMQTAHENSHLVFIGMLAGILLTKFTLKDLNHERNAYSN